MDIEILKKNYNKVLAREKNAERFINNASEEQLKTWLPEFNKIVVQLSQMINDYKKITGKEMSKEKVSNGFN